MSRIAVLIENGFEDTEYSRPAQEFKQAGHQLVHVGLKSGVEVQGEKQGVKVHVDESVNDTSVDDFNALFIPGGYSPDRLRAYPEAVAFVRAFMESGKPVLAICHGPQLLINALETKGRKMTGWKSIAQDLKNAGAQYMDQEVVVDKNLVTSRQPSDIPAFVKTSLEQLQPSA
jgi:protease I